MVSCKLKTGRMFCCARLPSVSLGVSTHVAASDACALKPGLAQFAVQPCRRFTHLCVATVARPPGNFRVASSLGAGLSRLSCSLAAKRHVCHSRYIATCFVSCLLRHCKYFLSVCSPVTWTVKVQDVFRMKLTCSLNSGKGR